MLSNKEKEQIYNWAKTINVAEADTIKLLAIAYINEKNVNWQSDGGRKSVSKFILKKMHYETGIKELEYNEGWIKHNPSAETTSPFEILSNELPQSAGEEMEDKIKNSTFPFEVKEILKETEDKSYKSPISLQP